MDKAELVNLLEDLAKKDLEDTANIYDHPCSVAIRALEVCFADIEFLKRIANGNLKGGSRKAKVLLGLKYNPEW